MKNKFNKKNKNRRYRHSISRQLTVIFIGLVALCFIMAWVVNNMWLENFYIREKEDALTDAFDIISEAIENDSLDSDEFNDYLNQMSDRYSLDVLVMNADSQMVVYTAKNPEDLRTHIWDHLFLGDETTDSDDGDEENSSPSDKPSSKPDSQPGGSKTASGSIPGATKMPEDRRSNVKKLTSGDNYEISITREGQSGSEYVELISTLDNDYMVLISSPVESIQESVDISNRFLAYIGLAAIVVSGIIIWIVSRRITKPILRLAEISDKMADLDFEAKYEGKDHNEIAILGDNINRLSDSLETTISELKTANNELEKDIAHKIEIDEMRKEFLSNVSHELKTPIALIQGYAEGLADCINDDEESRQFYLDVIVDEAKKMNQMVQKLLTLNQLEFGDNSVTMERFDILALISGCVNTTQILMDNKDISITHSEGDPIYVWGDEFLVEGVLTNYISNAINHCSGEKRIDIKVTTEADTVRVTVFNTGEPIPEECLEHLWTKFYKVDKARTRAYGGSGIGLSIVKASMESMNQKYGVNNYEDGVGFWFELSAR